MGGSTFREWKQGEEDAVTWLGSPPCPEDLPARFPNPFREGPPELLLERVRSLQAQFRLGLIAPGLRTDVLQRPEGGKMFGLLLVASAEGRIGYLKAFSGQLGDAWFVPGWAPPVFEVERRETVQSKAEASVKALTAQIEAVERSAELATEREALASLKEEWQRRHAELRARSGNAAARRERRAQALQLALEWKRTAWGAGARQRRLLAMRRLRRFLSRRAMRDVFDTYVLTNAQGRTQSLRSLFAPAAPPWGAGDCAAPKLLIHAFREGLRPLALAEFWWGPPPLGGGRVQGELYPPCSAKCGPILPFLLSGLVDTTQGTPL